MNLPLQSQPVIRVVSISKIDLTNAGVVASRKQYIKGMAKCTKGGSVLFTAEQTICAENTHSNCTAAKQAAVNSIAQECTDQGGIPQQSGNPCNVGSNC